MKTTLSVASLSGVVALSMDGKIETEAGKIGEQLPAFMTYEIEWDKKQADMPCTAETYPPTGLAPEFQDAPDFIKRGVSTETDRWYYEYVGLAGNDYAHATFDPYKYIDMSPEDLANEKPPFNAFTESQGTVLKIRKWDADKGAWIDNPTSKVAPWNNYMANTIRADWEACQVIDEETGEKKQSMWEKYRGLKTERGTGLGHVIATGVVNPTHFSIAPVGMVATCEQDFTLFKDLFESVTHQRHYPFNPKTDLHQQDLVFEHSKNIGEIWNGIDPTCTGGTNPDGTTKHTVDPDTGVKKYEERTGCTYAQTTRVRTGRSVQGYGLPPGITFEERRDLEKKTVAAIKTLTDEDLQFDYFALPGSKSFQESFAAEEEKYGSDAQAEGMSEEKADWLRAQGNMFQEPDSTLLLGSGCGRSWPDARGIFHNAPIEGTNVDVKEFLDKEKTKPNPTYGMSLPTVFVWMNEEDHLRVVTMQKGDNFAHVFNRWTRALNKLQIAFQEQGMDYMFDEHFGWLLTCPSNLGTGMRAGSLVKIKDLKDYVEQKLFETTLWENEGEISIQKAKAWQSFCANFALQSRNFGGVDATGDAGMYDISNLNRIGYTEIELMDAVYAGLRQFIEWQMLLDGNWVRFPHLYGFEKKQEEEKKEEEKKEAQEYEPAMGLEIFEAQIVPILSKIEEERKAKLKAQKVL